MLSSVLRAVKEFYGAWPSAGILLAPSGLWVSMASVLTWSTWQLNGKVYCQLKVKI